MKRLLTLAALALMLAASSVSAQVQVYNNTEAFQGVGGTSTFNQAQLNGGATSGASGTLLLADDLFLDPSAAGQLIGRMDWVVVNTDPTTALSVRPRMRFWADDGAGGGPGTLISGVTFNAISFAANTRTGLFFNFAASAINIPIPANSHIWIGMLFDDPTNVVTAAQLNEMAVAITNAPTIGSSQDRYFATSTPGSNLVSNPPGTILTSPFGGAPNANFNFGIQVVPVPEPTSLALVGLAGVAGVGLRRWKKRQA
jgi:hypothetical protein